MHYHRGEQAAQDVVAAITAADGRAEAFSADLSRPGTAAPLAEAVALVLGSVDVLVNNASELGAGGRPRG